MAHGGAEGRFEMDNAERVAAFMRGAVANVKKA
jgi:hypothetical protein